MNGEDTTPVEGGANDDSKPSVAPSPVTGFDIDVETLVIGAGACGLVAALAAREVGQQVLIVEADVIPSGSTALSAGLIPAAGTALQRSAGIDDSAERFAADIQTKANHENALELVTSLAAGAAEVIDWLVNRHRLPFSLVNDFDYPGHSSRRMHGLPTRSGAELVDALRSACECEGIDIVCGRRATILHREGASIRGVTVQSEDQTQESIGCKKLILACNGFGGNRHMVAAHLPDICDALWFGHDGNRGEAVEWGQALGASVKHLGAYQGHGNVAHPQAILISWAVITQGGIQVNQLGRRFWDESRGYSEAARIVLSQPDGIAYSLFDERIAKVVRQFEDFKQAEAAGAIEVADTLDELAMRFGLPADALSRTVREIQTDSAGSDQTESGRAEPDRTESGRAESDRVESDRTESGRAESDRAESDRAESDRAESDRAESGRVDEFGRRFTGPPLQAPYYAVRVTGALFHTQGGLDVDACGRVRRNDGAFFDNLFAGGGAACGVSGRGDSGYLSGNGLLSAVVLGYKAGRADIGS